MLAYWPKGVSVNENNKTQLGTYIGKPLWMVSMDCFVFTIMQK